MKAKVLSYNEDENYHLCQLETGQKLRVDIFIDGTLPKNITMKNIIGKTIQWDRLHSFIVIAHGVSIINEA